VGSTEGASAAQNVQFVDGDSQWTYNIDTDADATTKLSGFSDADLGSFLSRPLKIQSYKWTPNDVGFFHQFNPWSDFFSNSDVLDKINRYRNLRCNLRLKVLINGNSFYYGRAMLSYNPYLVEDQVTVNRGFFQQDLVQASQKPHLLIDPCSSQGGELCLPFIWPENMLDITNTGWQDEMGRCTIHDFHTLKHANGGTDPVTVNVFCWAENVTLSVPTSSVAQTGGVEVDLDEFGFPKYEEQAKYSNTSGGGEFSPNGLISAPASAVASAANQLSRVPVIGPYAKATGMVAESLGNIAKVFGYARPNNLEDTRRYTPRYTGNLANVDAAETLNKLSVDSKNELTVDTRVMGLGGHDEMTIHSIASRMSYWRQFDWPESADSDDCLTSFRVTPLYAQTLGTSTFREHHATALAFAGTPFDCWQGSIKFRFNVICSEYHRGRLRIVYNPKRNPGGAVPFNQTYSTVIDITESRDFEYEVKWADVRAWNRLDGIDTVGISPLHVDGGPITPIEGEDNGTLAVYVVNELATPGTASADIKIQVWVAGGDDIAFAVPSSRNMKNLSYFVAQSEIAPMVDSGDSSNSPANVEDIPSFAPSAYIPDDDQYLVYQGERIVSFRSLLRRYQYHDTMFPKEFGTDVARVVEQTRPFFPWYRGWATDGFDDAPVFGQPDKPYSYCNNTLLNYLTPAFVGYRGSLRYKSIVTGHPYRQATANMTVTRGNMLGGFFNTSVENFASSFTNNRRVACRLESAGLEGTTITPISVNPVVEWEMPYYTIGQRFSPARMIAFLNKTLPNPFHLAIDMFPDGQEQENHTRIDTYVSIGEDFTLGMFVGAPILYSYSNPVDF